jgi:predicted nucleic acid-binding protein
MTRYLLDTSTVIDLSKGHGAAGARIQAHIAAGDDVGICAITLEEFFAGLAPHRRGSWAMFFAGLRYWDITPQAAARAGHYRHALARRGRIISTQDALIAGTAWFWQAIVVTENSNDFPMPDVQVVSFRT